MKALGLLLGVALAVGVSGCIAGGTSAPGQGCVDDTDCQPGLQCMVFTSGADPDCDMSIQACSIPCETDADCQALGPDFTCFAACGGQPPFCGELGQ